MRVKKRLYIISGAIILVGTICAAALYWRQKAAADSETASYERIWHAVSCRSQIYLQKAKGEILDLSWTELWRLTSPQRGFHCTEGDSLEADFQYTASASEDDRREGQRIFRERCTGCHGADGSGGPHAPSLVQLGYKHGDSDLAIYKTLRDGIPGTAMPSADLSLDQLLQVVADVKTLHARASADEGEREALHLAIQVSNERLQTAGANPDEWLMYSGSYNGWRHSSLTEITPANVAQLRLRWIKQFDSNDITIEATPLAIGGTVFVVAPISSVLALDAKTGDVIWEYKRPIPANLQLCCGRVNRGLAVHGNTIFFGSPDGYLVAINANDGKLIWQTQVARSSDGYSITGAPLAINHSVVVGIAGGDYGVRGFLVAFDASTGEQQWKFETIPGPGEVGHETWENDAWRTGGGATWNTGSYDPSTDLLYWGVGNASPNFSGDGRPGDNLFTESVIALHGSTGKLAWYFQFTPHDEHDWDSAQTPVLADLPIRGEVRKVICWPNRNGFYYVLDRLTGEFLVGTPFVELDWAEGLTSAGRPILSNRGVVTTGGHRTKPGVDGGTNWQNAAFDQKRRLIFVPATLGSSITTKSPPSRVRREATGLFLGSGWMSTEPVTRVVRALDAPSGRPKWEYKSSTSTSGHEYSGLLSTEGGLVFGASGGALFALDADTGHEMLRVPLGGNTMAAPISFTLDGRQVIAVAAGRALFMFGL